MPLSPNIRWMKGHNERLLAFPLVYVEASGVGEGLAEGAVKSLCIYLSHAYSLGYGDDGAEKFPVLTWVETDGRELFVASKVAQSAHFGDEIIGGP